MMYNQEILEGMARAFFVCNWADYEEEHGRCYGGCELMDIAPETPQDAMLYAAYFYGKIEQANKDCCGGFSLSFFLREKYPDDDPDLFGHYLAMEGMGHGVGWDDDHEPHGLKIPYAEDYEYVPEIFEIVCPKCDYNYVDEDECTQATDEETSIIDHGMCRECHKQWQLKEEK